MNDPQCPRCHGRGSYLAGENLHESAGIVPCYCRAEYSADPRSLFDVLECLVSKNNTEELTDNLAVDKFAAVMKKKLAESRAKGRFDWQNCPISELWQMLRNHVDKGDPRDVACIAMMIWNNQQ